MCPCSLQPVSAPATDIPLAPLDLEQIYAQYVGPIYRFLYARVGNREDAEDLTSQVFLKAFRQLDLARAERSVASWLYTVARTVLADHWRREYRHGPLAEITENMIDRTGASDVADDAEKVLLLDEVLALLPARSRTVLELRFLRGYSVEETAQALGIKPGNVKVIQHRALARATNLMEQEAIPGVSSPAEHRAIA